MTAYAPNPTSVEEGAASLSSGLLARKGHALPAVDAVAHEGIDIDMAPREPMSRARKSSRGKTIATLRPAVARQPNQRTPATIEHAPKAWTISTPVRQGGQRDNAANRVAGKRLLSGPPSSAKATPDAPASGVRATVTFRMPVAEFVRLHYASRDMEETCQTVILDALSAYFDANDVEYAPQGKAIEEAARLVRSKSRNTQK